MINLSHMKGRRIGVMGLGKSGLATATALRAAGADVRAWDDGAAGRASAEAAGFALVDLHQANLGELEELIWSPGIPHSFPAPNPVAIRAREAGLRLVCDVDVLARAEQSATYVGITGTNGKSTTTTLIEHVLIAAGRTAVAGGNLGAAALSLPPMGETGIYVIEMSSYQLELSPAVTFDVAVMLNVTPDHLVRHGGMDGYIAAKAHIFDRQGPGQTAIIGIDDEYCRDLHRQLLGHANGRDVIAVSVNPPTEQDGTGVYVPGIYVIDGWLIDQRDPGAARRIVDLATLPTLMGQHNHQNAACAYATCAALGIPVDVIIAAMATFPGLAHRQQTIATLNGVRFVNDSKATNADATARALATFEPIHWILGGQSKDTGLAGLESYMDRISHAYLIGDATDSFAVWLERHGVPFTRCGTLDVATDAAATAALAAGRDSTVLLSPACASWDQFKSFEHRGDSFAQAVRDIVARQTAQEGLA